MKIPQLNKYNFPGRVDYRLVMLILLILVTPLNVLGIKEAYNGPGRLPDLIDTSDHIVIAECIQEITDQTSPGLKHIEFSSVTSIKGGAISTPIILTLNSKRVSYRILHDAKRILLFLAVNEAGQIGLTNKDSCIRLEGADLEITDFIKRYIEIHNHEHRNSLLYEFIFETLDEMSSDYLKENLAEDLWSLTEGRRGITFDGKQRHTVVNTLLASQSTRITEPLFLVLDAINSDDVNECFIHTLFHTENSRSIQYRLPPVLAKRKELLKACISQLEDQSDPKIIGKAISHLYLVKDAELLPALRTLSERNASSRPVIKNFLQKSGMSQGRAAFLKEQDPN